MNFKKFFCITSFYLLLGSDCYGQKCNGHEELCNRRYNEVIFPATHNGQSYKGASGYTGWLVSVQNQDKSISEQLKAGIRAMKIPLHYESSKKGKDKVLTACHGLQAGDLKKKVPRLTPNFVIKAIVDHPCYYDKAAQPLKDLIKEVKAFLDAHPNEVFTFFLEDTTKNHEAIAQAFTDAGLDPELTLHVQDKNKEWPTLGGMIKSGKRAVVFITSSSHDGKVRPWLLSMNNFVWQTDYNFGDVNDLKKDTADPALRGGGSLNNFNNRFLSPKNKVSVVQHFVTPSTKNYTLYLGGKVSEAKKANKRDVLMPRLEAVYKKAQVPLNFIWADFYEYGDLFDVVNQLNGVGKYSNSL